MIINTCYNAPYLDIFTYYYRTNQTAGVCAKRLWYGVSPFSLDIDVSIDGIVYSIGYNSNINAFQSFFDTYSFSPDALETEKEFFGAYVGMAENLKRAAIDHNFFLFYRGTDIKIPFIFYTVGSSLSLRIFLDPFRFEEVLDGSEFDFIFFHSAYAPVPRVFVNNNTGCMYTSSDNGSSLKFYNPFSLVSNWSGVDYPSAFSAVSALYNSFNWKQKFEQAWFDFSRNSLLYDDRHKQYFESDFFRSKIQNLNLKNGAKYRYATV